VSQSLHSCTGARLRPGAVHIPPHAQPRGEDQISRPSRQGTPTGTYHVSHVWVRPILYSHVAHVYV